MSSITKKCIVTTDITIHELRVIFINYLIAYGISLLYNKFILAALFIGCKIPYFHWYESLIFKIQKTIKVKDNFHQREKIIILLPMHYTFKLRLHYSQSLLIILTMACNGSTLQTVFVSHF